ncbi:MAG: transcriptional antiterminator, Rof [Gammaproteobacteria bacterium]|nr:transcriptional antiterminator, Rof [Gammaproteobacteria bacterium]
MTDYKPISCIDYSLLEESIVLRRELRLGWHDDDGRDHVETVRPVDLQTRASEEYLTFLCRNGQSREVRLDRIVRFEAITH